MPNHKPLTDRMGCKSKRQGFASTIHDSGVANATNNNNQSRKNVRCNMADYKRKDVEGFRYEMVEPIGVLSERTIQGEVWRLEANWVAWNGRPPKIDIRSWSPNHEHMSKGITMTSSEFDKLVEFMKGNAPA